MRVLRAYAQIRFKSFKQKPIHAADNVIIHYSLFIKLRIKYNDKFLSLSLSPLRCEMHLC